MYRQPRVPEYNGGDMPGFLKALVRFLKETLLAAWTADRQHDTDIAELRRRIEALEGE